MECFAVYADKIEGRIDPLYLKNILVLEKIKTKFSLVKLGSLLKHDVQYGANESAINGEPEKDVRYIRITDIDEFGNLKNNDWKTSQIIEKKYELNEGDILFARSGATAGKCFYYKNDYGKSIFAGYLIRFVFDEKKVNPKYIFYYSQSSHFKLWIITIQRPSGQPNINSEEFKSFKIPLPPLSTQNHIVQIMDNAYKIKKQKETEAKKLLNSIDEFVLNELGIKLPELKDRMVYIVDSDEIEGRIDPQFYKPDFKELKINLSKIKHKPLVDVIEFSSETWNQKDFFDNEFPYIEISEIDTLNGEIKNLVYYEKNKAPGRAKMIVREDDIIVSTTRPHRGAIAYIDKTKDGYIASTGFAILRNLKIQLNKKYLLFLLRTQLSLKQMLQRSSGGNYPAITIKELEKIIIPLPPLLIQRKIAEEVKGRMQKAERLQNEAKQLLEEVKGKVEKMILGE
jgi:restriction endonuclease S subunit